MSASRESESSHPLIDALLAEYMERVDRGEEVDREAFIQRHPLYADELRELLEAGDAIDQLASATPPSIAEPDLLDETKDTPLPAGTPGGPAPDIHGEETWAPGDTGTRAPRTPGRVKSATSLAGRAGKTEPGQRFGDYELLDEIARGGMGVVYKARQVKLNRTVALKMILAGQLASDSLVKRFYREAESAATLDHPHIVPIYEVGECERQHFFSMGYVEGRSLADIVFDGPLTPRKAAEIVCKIAAAIAYAHERGVIHRDLKPANILMDDNGEPRVMDFGLAKWRDLKSSLTADGMVMGTPSYMPPEQAVGDYGAIGPRSDVYSIGAVLYCLLTGRPPFQSASVFDTLKQVANQQVISPRELNAAISRDLETICLKCLQKKPAERYESAEALHADLQKYLNNEPIDARPISVLERCYRWSQRNRTEARLLLYGQLLLLISVSVAGIWINSERLAAVEALDIAEQRRGEAERERENASRIAKTAEQRRIQAEEAASREAIARSNAEQAQQQAAQEAESAELARKDAELARKNAEFARNNSESEKGKAQQQLVRAEQLLYANQIALAKSEWKFGNLGTARAALSSTRSDFRGWEFNYLYTLIPSSRTTFQVLPQSIYSIAFSPDGTLLAVGGSNHSIMLVDVESGRVRPALTGHTSDVLSVAFSPDGKLVASGCADETVNIWDVNTGGEPQTLKGHKGWVNCVGFHPDGKLLASAGFDNKLILWDSQSGEELSTLEHEDWATSVAFSPDGKWIVTGSKDSSVRLWSVASGDSIRTFTGHTAGVNSVAFSSDGTLIASGDSHFQAMVWDRASGKRIHILQGHNDDVNAVCFTPDGKHVATGSSDRTIKMWSTATGREVPGYKQTTSAVKCIAFTPGGRRLASGGVRDPQNREDDSAITLWTVDKGEEALTITGHGDWINDIAVSPDGTRIVSGSDDHTVRVWDMSTGKQTQIMLEKKRVCSVVFSRDGTQVASASEDNIVRVWNAATGEELPTLARQHSSRVIGVTCSNSGNRLISCSADGAVNVRDTLSGEVKQLAGGNEGTSLLCESRDGRRIATCTRTTIKVWELESGREISSFSVDGGVIHSIALSTDGSRIAVGANDKTLKVWDVDTGIVAFSREGHTGYVSSVTFSPDGTRIVSGSDDATIRIWNAATGQVTLTLRGHIARVNSVTFSGDGTRIVSAGCDNVIKVWDASKGLNTMDD